MFYLMTHSTHFIYGDMEGRKEMFYLTTHSTHFLKGDMASDIWWRTTQKVREETRCRHIGYSFRLAARDLLYAPSQNRTAHTMTFVTPVMEHWLEREIAQWVPHEGSIRRSIAPCSYHGATSRSLEKEEEEERRRRRERENFVTGLRNL